VTRIAEVLELDRHELFFLANPRAQGIISLEPNSNPKRAWEDFIKADIVRRLRKITDDDDDDD